MNKLLVEGSKVGIVSPYALPEKGAASMRVDSFASCFNSKNIKTTILAPERGVKGRSRFVKRYNNWRELFGLLRDFDFVILTTPPIKYVFFLSLYLKLVGKPFLVDVRDLAIAGRYPLIKSFLEFLSLRLCYKISVVTQFMKDYFVEKYKINPNKILLVPNGANIDIFYPPKNEEEVFRIRSELNIPKDSKVVLYAGIIGGHELLEFLRLLDPKKLEQYNVVFLFSLIVGETESKSFLEFKEFKRIIKQKGLSKYVRVMKNAIPSKVRDLIVASDYGLAPIPSNNRHLYRIPVKVFEYVVCKRVVLAKGPSGGELERFVKQYGVGYFSDTWEGLLSNLFSDIEKGGLKVKKDYSRVFDRKLSALKLLEFIKK